MYGFKPSVDRVPLGGVVSGGMEGVPGIKVSAGPLATSLDDIQLFMSTVLDAEPWKYDPTAFAAPWSPIDKDKPLTIGLLPEHPLFPLHPPVRRTVDAAVATLQAKGHRIVRLENTPDRDVAAVNRLAFQYFTYAPLDQSPLTDSGEPLVTSVARFASPLFTGPLPVSDDLPVFDKIDQLHHARQTVADAWRKVFVAENLDVVLAPGAQNTAVPHDTFGWPPYTALWNVIDVCAPSSFFLSDQTDVLVPRHHHPVRHCVQRGRSRTVPRPGRRAAFL